MAFAPAAAPSAKDATAAGTVGKPSFAIRANPIPSAAAHTAPSAQRLVARAHTPIHGTPTKASPRAASPAASHSVVARPDPRTRIAPSTEPAAATTTPAAVRARSSRLLRPSPHFLNVKYASWTDPSVSSRMNLRHVPDHDVLVFHTYVYWPLAGSYCSSLWPDDTVSSITSRPSADEQSISWDAGDPGARMSSPWSPPRLNFTGTAAPALSTFSTGTLSTGGKKPWKSNCWPVVFFSTVATAENVPAEVLRHTRTTLVPSASRGAGIEAASDTGVKYVPASTWRPSVQSAPPRRTTYEPSLSACQATAVPRSFPPTSGSVTASMVTVAASTAASHASPIPSPSPSANAFAAFATAGQLSRASGIESPSESTQPPSAPSVPPSRSLSTPSLHSVPWPRTSAVLAASIGSDPTAASRPSG